MFLLVGGSLQNDYVYDESSGYLSLNWSLPSPHQKIYTSILKNISIVSCCIFEARCSWQSACAVISHFALFCLSLCLHTNKLISGYYLNVYFSRYYYSSSTGYYYDPSSGLYCSASGQWYWAYHFFFPFKF